MSLISATGGLSAQHRKPQPSLTRGLLRLTLCAVAVESPPSLQSTEHVGSPFWYYIKG